MSKESIAQPAIQTVHDLIFANPSISELALGLYREFTNEKNPEKLFLIVKEILGRGYEGRATLLQMSHGTDELAEVARKILEVSDAEDEYLEEILGVKRFGSVINFQSKSFKEDTYDYFKTHGLTDAENQDLFLLDISMERYGREGKIAAQISGEVDNEKLVSSLTFGTSEPNYLELLGPKEILRLRNTPDQKMLLLGSFGKYSAREFRKYSEKITVDPDTYVIDIDPLSVSLIKSDSENKNNVVIGDARDMEFDEDTFDQVYTNHLFHFLGIEEDAKDPEGDVAKVLKEAARVLKPGGFLVVDEEPFGHHKETNDSHQLMYEISVWAKKFGLELARSSTRHLACLVRPEVGLATVDDLGFPHYENCLIGMDRGKYVRAIFVKK